MKKLTKLRFIHCIGWKKTIRKTWKGEKCYHMTVESVIGEGVEQPGVEYGGLTFDESDNNHLPNIPAVCISCGHHATEKDDVKSSRSITHVYNTASGRPEPGDVYYRGDAWWWSNWPEGKLCEIIVLPNGVEWNIRSRANNCARKDDTTHRCWCITGSIEEGNLNSDAKNCDTCSAGAGSIQGGNFHGYLRNGYISEE